MAGIAPWTSSSISSPMWTNGTPASTSGGTRAVQTPPHGPPRQPAGQRHVGLDVASVPKVKTKTRMTAAPRTAAELGSSQEVPAGEADRT